MRIPIATSSSQGRSIPLTAERLVNMYAEKAPAGSKSPVVVHGCPGLTRFCDIDTRRTRGLYRTPADGRLYAVVRNSLYYINSDGQATNLGTIDGSGRVGMADNGLQLCIVTGASGYTYSVTDGLQQITDDGFPGADTVTFLDGYFIFNNSTSGNRGQFFISDLLDGQVYDATDFATAESYPDNLLRVFADHSQLLLFGSETIEIWFNGGAADFPFVRAQGSVIEQGLGARWTVAKLDETVVWLDNEGIVRRLEGSTPVRISTHAIEYDISRGDWQNASAWSYVEEGHQFYVLTVPARDLATQQAGTYVYDAATQIWHERKSYRRDYSRSGFYARAYGKHITADIDRGRLYEQSLDVYEEDGEHLIAEMQFPQIQNDGMRFKVHRLQMDVEAGVGGAPPSLGSIIESDTVAFVDELNDEVRLYRFSMPDWSQVGDVISAPSGLANYDMAEIGVNRFVLAGRRFPESNVLQAYDATGDSISEIGSEFTGIAAGIPKTCNLGDNRIAYYDFSSDMLRTIVLDGQTWTTVGTPLDISPIGSSDIDSINETTVAIVNPTSDSITAYMWSDNSETWSQTGNSYSLGITSGNPVICCLTDEFLVVSISGDSIQGLAWDGNDFSPVGNIGTIDVGSASFSRLDDTTFAAFDANGDFLQVIRFDGTNWATISNNLNINSTGGVITSVEKNVSLGSDPSYPGPMVMLDVSGNTRIWDMSQNWRSMGKQGEYNKRVIWRRLGQHRSFTPRIAISAPVKRAVIAAYADIEPSNS